MRIAVLSDIHANLPAMQAVRAHVEAGGYDAAYCLGDLGGYASQPNEARAEVIAMGLPTVMGNYDEGVGFDGADFGCQYVRPFDAEMSNVSFAWTKAHTSDGSKAWLRSLPREIRFDAEGLRVLLCHGSPDPPRSTCSRNRLPGRWAIVTGFRPSAFFWESWRSPAR